MYTGKRKDLRPFTRIVLFVLTVSGIAFLPRAEAETIGATLDEAMAEADAAIHGTVVDVDYRSSSHSAGALPHAFVTYEVREVLAGQVASRRLTLRFIGGPDGRGRFLRLSHVPMFDVGHEDVLLVRGNGRSACPLVGCEDGRFRIHEGRAYSSNGVPVRSIRDGRPAYRGKPRAELLRISLPPPAFDELLENPEVAAIARKMTATMSMDELRRRYEQEAPATEIGMIASDQGGEADYRLQSADGGSLARKAAGTDRPLPATDLLESMRTAAAKAVPAVTRDPVRSLDPRQPFGAGLHEARSTSAMPPQDQAVAE